MKESWKYYDRLDKELFDNHSVASLIVLLGIGHELNFYYKNIPWGITWLNGKLFLSSPKIEEEQYFDNATDLVINAVIDGKSFMDVWDELVLDFLF